MWMTLKLTLFAPMDKIKTIALLIKSNHNLIKAIANRQASFVKLQNVGELYMETYCTQPQLRDLPG